MGSKQIKLLSGLSTATSAEEYAAFVKDVFQSAVYLPKAEKKDKKKKQKIIGAIVVAAALIIAYCAIIPPLRAQNAKFSEHITTLQQQIQSMES